MYILFTAIFVLPGLSQGQNQNFVLDGYVLDTDDEPLIQATIQTEDGKYAVTDSTGYYRLEFSTKELPSKIELTVQYVAKETFRDQIKISQDTSRLRYDIVMENLDLYMDEITVSAEPTSDRVSNSTYVIDRMAIEQSQAYTLGNLLQLIPGQTIMNPQLQGAQSINFRSDLSSNYSLNNAFGIGIYLNGQELNNNANMQSLNPLSNYGRYGTFGQSRFNSQSYNSGDSPGGGFDLRELPVGDIEKVEVVQGVASAEYGDISSGGIFIETSAGKSPLNATMRRSGGELGLSLNKGFQIHPQHFINGSIDYLYSNADPRDRVKSFNRISSSLLWTSYYGESRNIRNTLSVSLRSNLDDFKVDPDIGNVERTYYQNRRISLSNRLRIQSDLKLFSNLSFSVSGSWSESISHLDEYVNPGVRPVIDGKTEGVQEGTYHPSNYRSERRVLGEPVSLSSRITLSRDFDLDEWKISLSYGGNASFDANYGQGRVFDPLRPVPLNVSGSERPISYRELKPEVLQGGAFIESRINGEVAGKKTVNSFGVRSDIQHGYLTVSPRLNSRFHISDNFSLTAAYGLQVKSPGLIHLYPGPDYEDYTLLNSYTGNLNESINLVYTRISQNVSENVKPMRSFRSEAGFEWTPDKIRVSATVFRNISRDGITVEQRPEYLDLPIYEIVDRPQGEKPTYEDTGDVQRVLYSQGYVTNALYSRNWGVELSARTSKIQRIQTSFSLNVSYTGSYYFNQSENINLSRDPQPEEEIWYGIYPPNKSRSGKARALLTSTHHVSDLGLLLTLRSEAFLYNFSEVLESSNRPVAYVNNELDIVRISETELSDSRFDVLDRAPVDGNFTRSPSFVYFNFHVNVSKNIGENVRLSFFANNFLNIRPEVVNSEGRVTGVLNQSPYFGMELRLNL